MAVYQLRRIQLGKQTTFSNAVAATSLLRGVLDASATVMASDVVPAELGLIAAAPLSVLQGRSAEMELELQTTYEDVLYGLFGLFGSVTPTGTNPYTWTFAAPNQSAPNAQVYTVQYGMAGAEYRMIGGVISEWSLRSTAGEGLRETWRLVGRNIEANALTSGLPLRAVNAVSAVHGGLWIDPITNTHGTTAVNATLIESELTINTNRHVKHFEGLYPSDWGDGKWECTLRLALEWNASSKALVDSLLSGLVERHIQLRWQQSAGLSLTVRFAGLLSSEPELFGDRDGNATVELEFSALYTSQFANWMTVTVVNGVNNLP